MLVYKSTHDELVAQGQRQLTIASSIFIRQMNDVSERVAENVRVMALDFGLRTSIAQHDANTIHSVLRNHGRRIHAERMMLVTLDGVIESDTSNPSTDAPFLYPDLLEIAYVGKASAIVPTGTSATWLVVVPVLAPTPIAYIAAEISIDARLLKELAESSGLPETVELIVQGSDDQWHVLASTKKTPSVADRIVQISPGPSALPMVINVAGEDFVALAAKLDHSDQQTPLMAVLSYSIDQATRTYYGVFLAWAALSLVGLTCGLLATLAIARSVSRPIEELAGAVNRIARGEYWDFHFSPRNDEIGAFAIAFTSMIEAIRDREGRISHQASHDAVSGLPNRSVIDQAIKSSLLPHQPHRGAMIAIGLEGLTVTIKTLGHTVADRMVLWAADSLTECLEETEEEQVLLTRTSDTIFSLWLPWATTEDAITLANRVLLKLSQPYQEADLSIDARPAAGIAILPDHGTDANQLLQRSEVALQLAVNNQTPVFVYDQAHDPHRPERLSLMADLREGLEREGEFVLYCQPKLSLVTGKVASSEALIRWHHPKRGMIPPDAFISLAEETGNIGALTRWVLESGIKLVAQWRDQGISIRLALNLSTRDLADQSLPEYILNLLKQSGLETKAIVLEITESAVMIDPSASIQLLNILADNGIDLAIDDFGVGQSSFTYLRQLPVRELKIDQAFVRGLATSPEDRLIVRSIIELGHNLGYKVTAEGVENITSLDYLREINCDFAQGYYIAKPLPADVFLDYVQKQQGP